MNLILSVSADFVAFVDILARERDEDREEVLRIALGLLRIAQDARREGNGIAIVTPELDVEQEITI